MTKTVGQRIAFARKMRKKTQTEIAKHLGITRNAVSMWENDESDPSADNLRNAAVFLDVSSEWLSTNRGSMVLDRAKTKQYAKDGLPVQMARVVGVVSASNWKETEIFNAAEPDLPADFDSDRFAPVAIMPEPQYQGMPLFAVQVDGNSVNKVLQDGSYAICVPYWRARSQIVDGELVVIQRRRPDGLFEATIKQVRRSRGGWELRPLSYDPTHQTPIPYKENAKKSEIVVEIIGLVIGHAGNIKIPNDA